MPDNFFKEALKLHKEGWTAIDFGTQRKYDALKVDTLSDGRSWKRLDKRTWLALQALDKDGSKPV